MRFCNLRVAQGSMARCAVQSVIVGFLSGSCASRSLVWRGAQLNQVDQDDPLEVARRAGWDGATRQYKNSS
ncbi:hypothetical protein A2U01_0057010 [Trifolium medium]|uniref:Uncharacterized protein n=1 Tax=Trifolium medium TaxID=97028 RepID=A0A392RHQ9_9FABA|nr:hypothetical protein [Trifolium medium]